MDSSNLSRTAEDLSPLELQPTLQTIAERLGIPQIRYHLFLCATPTKPKCCDPAEGLKSWDYLKRRLRDLKLDHVSLESPLQTTPNTTDSNSTEPAGCVYRTKADCLRVCQNGPILLVYPDGIWYHSVTPDVIDRIIQEHLLQRRPVQEFVFQGSAPEP